MLLFSKRQKIDPSVQLPAPAPADRDKPFQLVKYFTFSSLGLIFCGTIVLSMLTTHWIRSLQYKKSEDYALLLIENLNHQVFMQFILPVGLKYGKIELRNEEQFDRMDSVVRSTMHSFKVEMVNIYAAERDIIAYSFSRDMIGRENLGGSAHQKAMQGKPTSKLAQTGRLWRLFLGMPKTIKIVTFAPLKADKPLSPTAPLGVVEIVQDLSSDYRSILRFQMLTLLTVVGVMSILFVLLTNVVKRGEGIIQKKTQEQLQLKDQLSRAKHLSSLGEMIAGVSHEIRNPLGIISSSAELLLKKMPADDAMRAIPAIIIEESTRLNAIITDFLNYARPSAPNLQECRIEEVIHKTIRYISSQIEKKGYAVGAHLDKNLPTIRADADMLYQAFLNLVINATQAMPEGGAIDVRATSVDNNLWIAFEDRGEGIPAEILEKIWDPFFTTKDKGTGLGLGIVRKIIEAHEGQIRIDNRPEGGTRVSIRLPVVERF